MQELFRGRRPWHDTERVYQELGRAEDFEPTDKEVKDMAQTVGELQTKLRTAVRERQETKPRKSEQSIST